MTGYAGVPSSKTLSNAYDRNCFSKTSIKLTASVLLPWSRSCEPLRPPNANTKASKKLIAPVVLPLPIASLPEQPIVVKAKFVSKLAESKIKAVGGAVQLVAPPRVRCTAGRSLHPLHQRAVVVVGSVGGGDSG